MDNELSTVTLPVHFNWKAPGPYGYRWLEVNGPERGSLLVEDKRNTEANFYSPIDNELFTNFITLNSREEMLSFAKLHGWLGIGEMIDTGHNRKIFGERVSIWAKEIRHMRLMNDLHASLKRRDESILRTYVHWNAAGTAVTVRIAMSSGVSVWHKSRAVLDRAPGLDKFLKPGDHIGPARLFLVEQLNKKMRQFVAPCLLLTRKGEMETYLRPTHLLGALWLQLYQAIAGLSTMRRCLSCTAWIDVKSRAKKVMCDKCVNNRKTYSRRYKERIEKIDMELRSKRLSSEDRKGLTVRRKRWEGKLAALQAVTRA